MTDEDVHVDTGEEDREEDVSLRTPEEPEEAKVEEEAVEAQALRAARAPHVPSQREIGEHDFDDWAIPGESQTDGGSDDAGFADRRGNDPARECRTKLCCYLEGPAVGLMHILAKQQDIAMGFEEVAQCGVDGITHIPWGCGHPG